MTGTFGIRHSAFITSQIANTVPDEQARPSRRRLNARVLTGRCARLHDIGQRSHTVSCNHVASRGISVSTTLAMLLTGRGNVPSNVGH
jgi:hypothetical protein